MGRSVGTSTREEEEEEEVEAAAVAEITVEALHSLTEEAEVTIPGRLLCRINLSLSCCSDILYFYTFLYR